MTVAEPSPIPEPQEPTNPVPDQDLVKRLLDEMELTYVIDDEGDLAAPWEHLRIYFTFRGEGDQRVFSVRTFYDRPLKIRNKQQLLESIDEWNRTSWWPKVYTFTTDDAIRLIGEKQTLIGTGVCLEHFTSCMASWIRSAIQFDTWIVEQLA
ncbi:YbjN domain-containing protein [Streptomyces sp. Wh19]|uniref:YbjN domain-containing protein n=1 Tax=Streptomyces sanglieri TaxID=193460 RepID=A0ABW2X6T6_9ACTN|nr:YbjN domain-containing protein [Streptomyces sp. Wh19]MDV9201425.1 YbjN domain-containing protein [Streptomyces sp. Wh19]